ncbi:radical SAM family heme chaperone HemW [Clostridium sp. DL1XJH146]
MKRESLYIHIPFCVKKCLYCDFPSYDGMEKYMESYMLALSKEIQNKDIKNLHTIYIGGGTPTYLSLDYLEILKKSLDKQMKNNKPTEFSIEVNPGTCDIEKLKFLKNMGVNRLSIGLQAWQNDKLQLLGRIHSREEFLKLYKEARKVGFKNINIDLMFGIPGLKLEEWEETLENIINLNPEHVSCYSLIIEEGTCFYKMFKENKLEIPNEDVERKMYKKTVELLKANGYNQYEISNFSKKGKECMHNLVYWELGNYLGTGSSAHSYIDGVRYENDKSIINYIKDMHDKGNSKVKTHINTSEEEIEEFMFLGLRKRKGISKNEYIRRFHEEINFKYKNVISKYTKLGLLLDEDDYISFSEKGYEISNYILSDFILDKK